MSEWPKCDALIGIYAKGFPLEKALDFVRLHKPIELNALREVPLGLRTSRCISALLEFGVFAAE